MENYDYIGTLNGHYDEQGGDGGEGEIFRCRFCGATIIENRFYDVTWRDIHSNWHQKLVM